LELVSLRSRVIHFIDHYDSFSFNLVDWLKSGSNDWHIKHYYFDTPGLGNYLISKREPVVFSPGPKTPIQADDSIDLVRQLAGSAPILGVCLGHQIIASAFGAAITRSKHPVHGETRRLHFQPDNLIFKNLSSPISVAVYNSLIVRLPPSNDGRVLALNDEGEIQAIEYFSDTLSPAIGLQFHPESFLMGSESKELLKNWFGILEDWYRSIEDSNSVAPPLPRDVKHPMEKPSLDMIFPSGI